MKLKNKNVTKLRHPKMVSYGDVLNIPTHPCKHSAIHGMRKDGSPAIKRPHHQMIPKPLLLFLWFSLTLTSPMPSFQGSQTCNALLHHKRSVGPPKWPWHRKLPWPHLVPS